jgi:hypothetical protein
LVFVQASRHVSDDPKQAKLREALARGLISAEDFRVLTGGAEADARARGGAGIDAPASAPAPRPTPTPPGARGVVVDGDNRAAIHTGDNIHHHHHAPAAPGTPDPAALQRVYLQRLWRQCDVPALLAGGDTRRAVRLGAIYTALMTEVPLQGPGKRGGRDIASDMLARGERRNASALEMLDREPQLVILGGPGSGKSTFVNFVAQALAGELLGADAEQPEPSLATLTAPLPAEEEPFEPAEKNKPAPPQPWRHGALLPALVVLRDLAAQLPPAGERVGAENVRRYWREQLEAAGLRPFAPVLEAHLSDKGGLVMFDGLDEVPDAKQRREQTKQVVEDFAASHARCRLLVTSRTYAYQEQNWKLRGFAEVALAEFTLPQITAAAGGGAVPRRAAALARSAAAGRRACRARQCRADHLAAGGRVVPGAAGRRCEGRPSLGGAGRRRGAGGFGPARRVSAAQPVQARTRARCAGRIARHAASGAGGARAGRPHAGGAGRPATGGDDAGRHAVLPRAGRPLHDGLGGPR